MATHVKLLGIIHIVFGALGLIGAVIVLLIFGGLAGMIGASDASPDAHLAAPVLGGIGGIIFLVVASVALPGLIAGIGLLQFRPWARILTIVLSAIHLLGFPVGTALGVYGLWTLLNRETEALFDHPQWAGA